MKLDRNLNDDGTGKYALLKLRNLEAFREEGTFGGVVAEPIASALKTLDDYGIVDWGNRGAESEFMVIRLKDKYAGDALASYAAAAAVDDPEWAAEVADMAGRAGVNSPWCKRPD